MGCLSWVGLTGETGLSPRPSEAIGHCPCKPWMNAACVPVSESGDKSGPASKTRKSFPDPFAYLRKSAVPPLGFSGLTEDVRDNVTADIGEPKIPSGIAIGEFLVIESE